MNKLLVLLALFVFSISSCTSNTENEHRLRTENLELRQEVDSLKDVISKSTRHTGGDTVLKLTENANTKDQGSFTGQHALTLQWISWDQPGSVTIIPSENGWYTIAGQQTKNDDYLKITGRIKPLNERELEFIGEIETRVSHLNNGEPCLKTGRKFFKATGSREYWRLQDMSNCESASTLDYIDIYF
ncbi:hypothetical protein GZH53_10380 [Flavihumibacter sp. R14]|nr:hypothetical protein [Flavihumibacter soli]